VIYQRTSIFAIFLNKTRILRLFFVHKLHYINYAPTAMKAAIPGL
jgi:hypothetical protein